MAAVGPEAGVVHRVQHAAVDRLETGTDLGQRPADDDAHRVIDVAALHLLLDVDRFDAVGGRAVVSRRQGGVSPRVSALCVFGYWPLYAKEATASGISPDEAAASLAVFTH